jgi:DNA polymerase III subunit alpha
MDFSHLHVRSAFSFLEGLASPAELAQAASRLEMPALALTDHNRLSGAIEFYDACRQQGVQPVLGMEAEVLPPPELAAHTGASASPLTLLACEPGGWGSLCRLSSRLQADPAGATPLPFPALAEGSTGLLCLTGGERSLLNRLLQSGGEPAATAWLERLRELFAGRLYVELQIHSPHDRPIAERLSRLAARLRLPTVATHSIHYLLAEQAPVQRTAAAIRLNRQVGELRDDEVVPPGVEFIHPEEMARRFQEHPRALAATQEIAERCQVELPLGKPHFPALELAEGETPIAALRRKAQAGAQRYYASGTADGATLTAEVQERLDHELSVIGERGYETLFLVMEEIVGFARASGIPIASRGSASSSLVAHCLGVTTPDPVGLNLYFERFLNPARATPPDIDTDLCSRRRDEVIDFVYRRFGAERVAMVCTVNRFRRRSALREVAKAHGLPAAEISALSERLPYRGYGPPGRRQTGEPPYAELAEQYASPRHRQIFLEAAALIGLPRHLSIHPGGIVIAPGPLTDLAPTQLATKGVAITQFDLDSIERLGLVKIDLLGIRGLTVMGDVAAAIQAAQVGPNGEASAPAPPERKGTGRSFAPPIDSNPLEVLEGIPAEDPATSEMVEHGKTIGCFQIESPGMRATLKEIHARTTQDILAALALYRPGPLTGGLKDAFVARYRGLEPAVYLHPALEPLLGDTYGVILYQEQVLRIAHELAGLSLADADLLRRAMSHFDPGKQMQSLKERFLAGAALRNRVPEPVAERIWELMAAFAGYGFPKAHAASYARVAWQSAWCKTHHPALFMAAVLANWGGYYGQRVYLTEARRLGLAIRPPQVDYALAEFSARWIDSQPVLFMGLNQVRELTRRTQARILQQRPFRSFLDFLARADPRPVEARNLVRAGALQSFGTIPALLRQLEQGGWRGGQLPLFDLAASAEDDWPLEQKIAAEEELLGVGVSAHPLELHAAQIALSGALTTVEAAARLGQRVRVAGMRQTWRRSQAAGGETIYFLALEDLEGVMEVVIFGEVYRRCRAALSGPGPYLVEGVVELDEEKGEPYIRAERVERLQVA